MYQVCYTRYHVSFYLWLIGSVLKHCKVPKYYDHDCRFVFLYVDSKFDVPKCKYACKNSSLKCWLRVFAYFCGVHKNN